MNSQNPTLMEAASDHGPHHLAQAVFRALSVSAPELPSGALLELFFETVYQASFRAEQGRLVWLDLEKPAASAQPLPAEHLELTPPVAFQAGSVSGLLGVGGEQAALLVTGSGSEIVICGIARQGQVPPELFSVDILGPAHLKVDAGLDCPLELRRNHLHLSAPQVFERGPVRERLSALLQGLFPAIQAQLPAEAAASPLLSAGAFPLPGGHVLLHEQDWPDALEHFWLNSLGYLLRCFQDQAGGLMALTPRRSNLASHDGRKEEWLPTPHEAVFTQTQQLLEQRAVSAICRQADALRGLSERLAAHEEIPSDESALQEPVLWLDSPESDPGTAAALRFLAGLSQPDGILRLDPSLSLISFGGEPAGKLPERVYLAGDEAASEPLLSPISSRSFGPRNQALLRLCQQDPAAVGFAVTQDKELRVMLWHDNKLIIWNSAAPPRTEPRIDRLLRSERPALPR